MPKYPVKPRDGIFITGRLVRRFERFYQTLLYYVFREMRIADAIAGEGREDVQILDQGFFETAHAASLERHMRPRKAATNTKSKLACNVFPPSAFARVYEDT